MIMRKVRCITVLFCLALFGIVLVADLGFGGKAFFFLDYIPGGDKTGHFLLMGIFSFLININLSCRLVKWGRLRILKGNLIVLIIVTIEEISQGLLASRNFDLGDLFFDYLGIFFFGSLARLAWRYNLNHNGQMPHDNIYPL